MKKKLLVTVVLSLVMMFAFSSMAMASDVEEEKVITTDLYNIGYFEVNIYESVFNDDNNDINKQFRTISSEDEVKLANEVKQLKTLSSDEYQNEIEVMVKNIILENKDRDNVYWTKDFINNYASKYCPEYVDELNSKVLENELISVNSTSDSSLARAITNKSYEYEIEWKGFNLIKYWSFAVRVDWTWDSNNKITYCAPKTVGKTFAPLTYYNGVVDEYINKLDNGARYEIYKQGHFSFAYQGDGVLNKYPYIGMNVYGGGAVTLWYGAE